MTATANAIVADTADERSGDTVAQLSPRLRQHPGAGPTDLTKVSVYLDERTDGYLEIVRAAGRRSQPKVDATRSAVVRLALNRLVAQMDVAEVLAALRRNADAQSGPGRKRS